MKVYLLSALILFVFGAFTIPREENKKITIAAASDLKFALDDIITTYKKNNPRVEFETVYGSSGKLFEQIKNGAPFDLFFSADINYPKELKDKSLISSSIKTYGIGRIVIWSKKIDPNTHQIKSLLNSSLSKIAIANPEHAPYGKRAMESLKFYKIYNDTKPKLVYGENISQTAQFITSGAADIGIIALSLALSPTLKNEKGKYYLIPECSHTKLEQGCVILKRAKKNNCVKSFFEFLSSNEAIVVLKNYGFSQD